MLIPFFSLKVCKTLPTLSPKTFLNGAYEASRMVMLTCYFKAILIADANSIPINPAPMMVMFLAPFSLIASLIFL